MPDEAINYRFGRSEVSLRSAYQSYTCIFFLLSRSHFKMSNASTYVHTLNSRTQSVITIELWCFKLRNRTQIFNKQTGQNKRAQWRIVLPFFCLLHKKMRAELKNIENNIQGCLLLTILESRDLVRFLKRYYFWLV